MELADRPAIEGLFQQHQFDKVVNLAAQAGVRYSLENPHAYVDSNLVGFVNILEGCRHSGVKHLVYASSSSVYGANTKMPFSVHHNVDHPVSLYAATKKANELMAHTYSHLYQLPTTGLRFFTVYGPWGRPDMALFLFTKAILAGETDQCLQRRQDATRLHLYRRYRRRCDPSHRQCARSGTRSGRATSRIREPAERRTRSTTSATTQPVELEHFIATLEKALGKTAKKNLLPLQPGDVPATYADVDDLMRDVGFRPATPIEDGIQRFVDWYRGYHHGGD